MTTAPLGHPITETTPHNWFPRLAGDGNTWTRRTQSVMVLPRPVMPEKPTTHTKVTRCISRGGPLEPWRLTTWVAPTWQSDLIPLPNISGASHRALQFFQGVIIKQRSEWEDHICGMWGSVRLKLALYDAEKRYVHQTRIHGNAWNAPVLIMVGQWLAPGDHQEFAVNAQTPEIDTADLNDPDLVRRILDARYARISVGINLSVSAAMLPIEFDGSMEDPANWIDHPVSSMLTARSWVDIQFNPFAQLVVDDVMEAS